jgi:hypothetical protein
MGCVEALVPVRSKTRRGELGLVAAAYDRRCRLYRCCDNCDNLIVRLACQLRRRAQSDPGTAAAGAAQCCWQPVACRGF